MNVYHYGYLKTDLRADYLNIAVDSHRLRIGWIQNEEYFQDIEVFLRRVKSFMPEQYYPSEDEPWSKDRAMFLREMMDLDMEDFIVDGVYITEGGSFFGEANADGVKRWEIFPAAIFCMFKDVS